MSLNILVVDDDVNCLASVEALLEQDGHRISTATRGLEALKVAQELRCGNRRLELSILDFHMPDLTGLETFELLNLELPGMGAIFISGSTSRSLEQMVLAAGGYALISKPLHVPRLREVIGAFASERRSPHGRAERFKAYPKKRSAGRSQDGFLGCAFSSGLAIFRRSWRSPEGAGIFPRPPWVTGSTGKPRSRVGTVCCTRPVRLKMAKLELREQLDC